MIRVAVVDDHPLVREGTAAIVERAEEMEIAGVTGSLEELRPVLDGSVDVLLLDLRLAPSPASTSSAPRPVRRCRPSSS